jgi:hypothetical protein
MRLWKTGVMLVGVAVIGASLAAAQKPAPISAKKKASRTATGSAVKTIAAKTAKPSKPVVRVPTSQEREEAAMAFARQHHPELVKLLARLKKKRRRQFDRAVKDLFRTSERLGRIRERTPDRYQLALEAWKLDSRIRLLAARMTMQGNLRLESQLTKLLRERVNIRLQQLTQDRERLAGRLQRIDQAIENISRDPEAAALKDLQRVKRTFDKTTSRSKQKKGSAASAAKSLVAPTPEKRPAANRTKTNRQKRDKKP